MIYAAQFPICLWSIAVKTMAYLKSRSPTWANNWQEPDLSHLRIFGCLVSVAIPKQKRFKWGVRSKMGYMVGYEPYPSDYLVWYPETRRVEKVRDMVLHEDVMKLPAPILYGDEGQFKEMHKDLPCQKCTAIGNPTKAYYSRSDVLDYPQRSGKIYKARYQQIRMNKRNDEPVILSTMGDNPSIEEVLSMPGEEGEAWEGARQAVEEYGQSDHKVFKPPEESPPGTHVLKTGTVCRSSYKNGKLFKRKVCIK